MLKTPGAHCVSHCAPSVVFSKMKKTPKVLPSAQYYVKKEVSVQKEKGHRKTCNLTVSICSAVIFFFFYRGNLVKEDDFPLHLKSYLALRCIITWVPISGSLCMLFSLFFLLKHPHTQIDYYLSYVSYKILMFKKLKK